ncbi:MAG: hypothetical protein FJZ11_04875 [Candidatus Omnitrophica bacterium]|nr:hypothetical protein [Candidatus Omnitrophota bacterium]
MALVALIFHISNFVLRDSAWDHIEIKENKPRGEVVLRVAPPGESGAVGGLAMRRHPNGESTIGIGWESGIESRWDLDLIGGTNDLNLNNKNISGNLLLNFGNTLRFGRGTGENPEIPDIAMIDLDGLAVGTTVRQGIPNRSIGLPSGGALSFADKEGRGQSAMFTALDLGKVENNHTASLESFGTKIPYAIIIVLDDSGEGIGIFALQGSLQTALTLSDPNGRYSTRAGTDNSINIYFNKSAGRYELENKSGSSSTFLIFIFRRT